MKLDSYPGLDDIFLDYCVKNLMQCFAPLTGWKHTLESMSQFLHDPKKQYFSEFNHKTLEEFVNEKHAHVFYLHMVHTRESEG